MYSVVTTTSDELSASAVVYGAQAGLYGFELMPPLSGLASLKIYDSGTATTTGKKAIAEATVAAGSNSINLSFNFGRVCGQGIYAVLTGTTTYIIAFAPR